MKKEDIKHHKYVKVNKQQRKKNKIALSKPYLREESWFKCLKPIYSIFLPIVRYYYYLLNKYPPKYIDLRNGYRPYNYTIYYRYQQASHKLVWNDVNHTSCRILVKKQKGYSFVTERPFRGINYKVSVKVFDRFNLFKW